MANFLAKGNSPVPPASSTLINWLTLQASHHGHFVDGMPPLTSYLHSMTPEACEPMALGDLCEAACPSGMMRHGGAA
jgi:hypothetical protein